MRLYGDRAEVCLNCMVGARPLVWLAEPGDVGVASPKQKRYAMRTVFVLARLDKKDATINISLTTLLQLKTRCQIRKIVFFTICSAF